MRRVMGLTGLLLTASLVWGCTSQPSESPPTVVVNPTIPPPPTSPQDQPAAAPSPVDPQPVTLVPSPVDPARPTLVPSPVSPGGPSPVPSPVSPAGPSPVPSPVGPSPTPTYTDPTICPTEDLLAPILSLPPDGAHIKDTLWPALSWHYPANCHPMGYRIDLATDPSFADTSLSGGTGNPNTTWAPGHELEPDTQYWWRVAPINDYTLGPFSETWTFTILVVS